MDTKIHGTMEVKKDLPYLVDFAERLPILEPLVTFGVLKRHMFPYFRPNIAKSPRAPSRRRESPQ